MIYQSFFVPYPANFMKIRVYRFLYISNRRTKYKQTNKSTAAITQRAPLVRLIYMSIHAPVHIRDFSGDGCATRDRHRSSERK